MIPDRSQYFKLTYHERVDNDHVAQRYELGGAERFGPWECRPLSQEMFASTRLIVRGKTIADYLPNRLSWPICSDRFLQVFRSVVPSDQFQAFSLQVFQDSTSAPVGPYTLINILKLVDAIDEKRCAKSFVGKKGDPFRMTPTPIIQLSRMPREIQLCRLRYGSTSVIVSGHFLEAARNAKVTGVSFIPIESVP